MKQHQPKGSMCQTCCGGSSACASLPFAAIPVIKAYPDGVKAVSATHIWLPPVHRPAAVTTAWRPHPPNSPKSKATPAGIDRGVSIARWRHQSEFT